MSKRKTEFIVRRKLSKNKIGTNFSSNFSPSESGISKVGSLSSKSSALIETDLWIRKEAQPQKLYCVRNAESPGLLLESAFSVRKFNRRQQLRLIPVKNFYISLRSDQIQFNPKEIETISQATFAEKVAWFQKSCEKLKEPGSIEVRVSRKNCLMDSVRQVLKMNPRHLKKDFKINFKNEPAFDVGGVQKDWFHEVCSQLFNPDLGVFEINSSKDLSLDFNFFCKDLNSNADDLLLFAGRLVGKALMNERPIEANFSSYIFKHIVASPISIQDLREYNPVLFNGLVSLQEVSSLDQLFLNFSVFVQNEKLSKSSEIELISGGKEIEVSKENLADYVRLLTNWYLFEKVKHPLEVFLTGLYQIIPVSLLSIFSAQQLKLLLCGVQEININSWKLNTRYKGTFSESGENENVVKWWWEYLESKSSTERIRILQFCTGYTRIPASGFGGLQGKAGKNKLFALKGVPLSTAVYPLAHVCFNRLDLPAYESREMLCRRLDEMFASEISFSDE